jgi:hypothetical protein
LSTTSGGYAGGVSEFFLADFPVVGVESGEVGGARIGVELVLGLLPVCKVLANGKVFPINRV